MKKIITISLLTLATTITLTGCGSSNPEPKSVKKDVKSEEVSKEDSTYQKQTDGISGTVIKKEIMNGSK